MHAFTAGHHRRTVIAVIDLIVCRRERIDIEAICVQEIGKFLATVQVQRFAEPELSSDLEQSLDNFQGCETFCGVPKGCHLIGRRTNVPSFAPDDLYDYVKVSKVVRLFPVKSIGLT